MSFAGLGTSTKKNKKCSFSAEDYYAVSISLENIQDKVEFHWLA